MRFLGTTDFEVGEWAGVELDEELGKHSGTVKGIAYFQCAPNKGMFVRKEKVRLALPSRGGGSRSGAVAAAAAGFPARRGSSGSDEDLLVDDDEAIGPLRRRVQDRRTHDLRVGFLRSPFQPLPSKGPGRGVTPSGFRS